MLDKVIILQYIAIDSFFQRKKGAVVFVFLLCFGQFVKAQTPIQQFWQLNQSEKVSDTLVWDVGPWNRQINNGSGTLLTTNPVWTGNKGKTNMKWNSCKNAVFGGNMGTGAAGTVTLGAVVNNVKSISFFPAASGNFTINSQSITTSCATDLPVFVAAGLSPTIASVLTGSFELTKTGSGTLNLSGNNTFTGNMIISDGSVNYAGNNALGASAKTVTLGDQNTPPGNIASFSIGNGINTTQSITAVITTDYAIPQFTLNSGSSLGGNTAALKCELRLNGNKPLTYFSTNTSGHSTAQDWTGSISGTGIAAGNTAIIFDGSGAPLRATFGGTTNTTINNFTGDVIIKGNVQTQNTAYVVGDAAHQNLGFLNNNLTLQSGATWTIAQGQETIQGLNGTGAVAFLGAGSPPLNGIELRIGNNNSSGSFSGGISGGYGISKIGTGTQTFSNGALTYTGVTNIDGGTLELNNTTNWKSTVLNAQPGTVWKKSGTSSLALSWGTGSNYTQMKMMAGSTFDIQGGTVSNNNVTNEWVNNLGSVNIASGAKLDLYSDPVYLDALTGSGTIINGYAPNGVKTLYVGVSGTTNNTAYGVTSNMATFSGVIDNANGNVAVVKQGTGTQVLSGNNTYSGGTTINGGTLTAGNVNAFGTGTITVNAGATLNKNGFNITNTIIVNSGGTELN